MAHSICGPGEGVHAQSARSVVPGEDRGGTHVPPEEHSPGEIVAPARPVLPVPKTTVFVVDSQPIVREGFKMMLKLQPAFTVCGETDNGPDALRLIPALKPDVAVVALVLTHGNGLELIKDLRRQAPRVKVLVFTSRDEDVYVERALHAGADGYVTKDRSWREILEALQTVAAGKRYLSPELAQRIMNRVTGHSPEAARGIETLTDRELQVLQMLGDGLSSREAAERLHVTLKTIESHREHLKAKLDLNGAAALVSYAFDWARPERSGNGKQRPAAKFTSSGART